MSKALLIKSYTTLTTGTSGKWNDLNMASSYIQGIQTGKILDDVNADKIASLISGVPTPWARAKLFKFALDTLNNPDPAITNSGLTQYYEMLYGEWKGLITIMALHSDRIRFSKPIILNIKGDDYNIASAFGRMLFNDKDIWSNQDELAKNPDAQPYIQLIYYRDHLVGGTSPLTGCFTGVNYSKLDSDASDINWYRNGKFEDPLPYINPDQRQKLYLFIKNINSNLDAFEQKINQLRTPSQRISIDGFKGMSRAWEEEIRNGVQTKLRDKGPIPTYGQLSCPFSLLFESNVPVYMTPEYKFTYINGSECKTIGDIQNLLSTDSYVIGWTEDASQRQKLSDAPVYFLQVLDLQSNTNCYFSLPLSEMGIDIFKNNLSSILGYTESGNTHLSATINDAGQLSVTLVVEIDGEKVTLNTREYEIDWISDLGKVIMWPNFVSDNWDKYYLYSEFTVDKSERFLPIFKYDGEIIRDGNNHFLTSSYTPAPSETLNVDFKQLITYPTGLGEDLIKYNIIASNKPIEGLLAMVKQSGKDVNAGYLMLRHSIVEDLTSINISGNAVVGIDFGSNNTCVYYNANDRGAMPIQFENNRTVLVGKENEDKRANASNDELLFFTNSPAENGQLKSWLHEHDSRYNPYNQSEEIAGGVPVNRPNVIVRKMDEYEITTQAGTLHYNMKWLDNTKGLEKKKAYLKSIWLQTCAFLYKNKIKPEEISWSHPGSMMESDVNDYDKIFNDLIKITPYGRKPSLNAELPTEAEAVCSFALSQDFGLSGDNMFLGIDVGGSTSDILLLSKDPNNNNKASLYRESSVRLAAGVFFEAIIKSETFRQALVNFHESNQKSVYVSNIKDVISEPSKAPYYLNNIFDQLKTSDDYDIFYDTINRDAKFAFTIPAYVTGLLLYYSGMLIGKAIKERNLTQIKKIDILSFGKGGRIFHWLRNSAGPRATKEYYSECLNSGVQLITNVELVVKYRDEIEIDNKAEVAKGLCDPREVLQIQDKGDMDICGEFGVKYIMPDGNTKTISVEDELTGDYFANDMTNFDFKGIKNFENFMSIFIKFVSQKTKLYVKADSELREDLNDLPSKIAAFICNNDREYKKAKEKAKTGDGFHYHQPIIIAEGICFLNTLIRKAFNQ
ncbi:MAG: hypothetical protein RRY07_01780 [Bacteroidaceae bacterium]